MKKTNVIRILEKENIPHRIYTIEVNETDLSGIKVSDKTGVVPERVFKTLVARGDKTRINVYCIPLNKNIDLKKAACLSNNKRWK